MVSLNKVMIIGNVGGDPEMRFTPSGHPVTSFRVAATRRWDSPMGTQRRNRMVQRGRLEQVG